MQEFTLVHFWMAGVMLVMAAFAGAAIVGHYRQQHHRHPHARAHNLRKT